MESITNAADAQTLESRVKQFVRALMGDTYRFRCAPRTCTEKAIGNALLLCSELIHAYSQAPITGERSTKLAFAYHDYSRLLAGRFLCEKSLDEAMETAALAHRYITLSYELCADEDHQDHLNELSGTLMTMQAKRLLTEKNEELVPMAVQYLQMAYQEHLELVNNRIPKNLDPVRVHSFLGHEAHMLSDREKGIRKFLWGIRAIYWRLALVHAKLPVPQTRALFDAGGISKRLYTMTRISEFARCAMACNNWYLENIKQDYTIDPKSFFFKAKIVASNGHLRGDFGFRRGQDLRLPQGERAYISSFVERHRVFADREIGKLSDYFNLVYSKD